MTKKKTGGRHDEDSVRMSITIRRPTYNLLKRFSREEGLKLSRAIDRILATRLEARAKRKAAARNQSN